MPKEEKSIWEKISSNPAVLIFIITVVFSTGKYTGGTDEGIKQLKKEFDDYRVQQQYQRTQDNLFLIEIRQSINRQNVESREKKEN